MTSKKHISILVVLVFLFTSLFSSFAFAADEMVVAEGITIVAKAHVQTHGDLKAKSAKGEVQVGTTGEKKRLESFSLELEGAPADMFIAYSAHVQTYGDLDAVVGPKTMGTTGEKKRVEAVAIALVDKAGDLYEGYSVEYRVHQQSYGWSKWVKDGEFAGVKGDKKRIEAIEVRVLEEAALKVTKVTADNLKKVSFTFNSAIDEDFVNGDYIAVADRDAQFFLSEDGKTVDVVLNAAAKQGDKVKVTFEGLTAVNGKELDYTWEERVFDTKVPVMAGAAVLNHKQIEIFFNEPVNFSNSYFSVLSNIKLDGISVIAKAVAYPENNSVVLEFPSLLKNGTQELSVSGIKDFADLEMAATKTSITVVEDKEAPVMTKVDVKNINEIHVTFNEKLSAIGEYWINGTKVSSGNVEFDDAAVGTIVKLTGFTLDLSSVVELKVEYKGQKDVVGNEVKDTKALTTKVADDTALPSVTLEVKDGNEVVLTFSKSMLKNTGSITVLNKDGNEVVKFDTAGTWETNNTVLKLTGSALKLSSVDPGQYTLVLKGLKDATVRQNLLPEQKINFSALDTLRPTVAGYFTTNKDTMTVYFSEVMDKASAENRSNYTVTTSGSAISLAAIDNLSSVKLSDDGKSVAIAFKEGKLPANITNIAVSALKDLAGNMINPIVKNVASATSDQNDIAITTVTAIAVNKVKVEFNEAVKTIDPSVFVLTKDGADVEVFVSATIASDGMSATFTTNGDLGTDARVYRLRVLSRDALVNVYNGKLPTTTTNVAINVDKVSANVEVATGTTAGSIVVKFSESMKVDSVADLKNDLLVRKDGVLVSIADGKIAFNTSNSSFNSVTISGLEAGKYTVELIARNVKDQSNNIVNALSAKEVTAE